MLVLDLNASGKCHCTFLVGYRVWSASKVAGYVGWTVWWVN